jgi:hypothetical protein
MIRRSRLRPWRVAADVHDGLQHEARSGGEFRQLLDDASTTSVSLIAVVDGQPVDDPATRAALDPSYPAVLNDGSLYTPIPTVLAIAHRLSLTSEPP